MFLFFRKRKNLFIFNIFGIFLVGTSYGLSILPWTNIFLSASGEDEGEENAGTTVVRRRKSWYPRFILGSSEDGRELQIEAGGLFKHRGSNSEIPFSQVTMKWGTKQLKSGDVLVSMCDKGAYYVAQHVWNTQYRLDTWETVLWSQFKGGDCKPFNKAKSINLNFKKKGEAGGGSVSKIIIAVNSCNFKWNMQESNNQEWKNLEMNCKGDSGEIGADKEDITLTLRKRDYKPYYKYTVTVTK